MLRLAVKFLPVLLVSFLFAGQASLSFQQAKVSISTPEEFQLEFTSVPCKDKDRLDAVKALFLKMGASESDISVEKFKNVENLVVSKPGPSQERIVLGAHYDKVSDGCGAVDNWTGIVTLAHLYKTIKDTPLNKSFLFVAFGKEEKGLVGSNAMVGAIKKEDLPQYCAMINIDSLGMGVPQAADNMSSKKLLALAADLAKEAEIPYAHASIAGADADSSSFLDKKIPAITIHGLTNQWSSILHSSKDQPSKVNAASVYLGYRLALLMLSRLDASSCHAYN